MDLARSTGFVCIYLSLPLSPSNLVSLERGTETEEGYMGVVSGTCFICSLFFPFPFSRLQKSNWKPQLKGSEVQDPDVRDSEGRKGPRGNSKKDKEDESARNASLLEIRILLKREKTTARGDGRREKFQTQIETPGKTKTLSNVNH